MDRQTEVRAGGCGLGAIVILLALFLIGLAWCMNGDGSILLR